MEDGTWTASAELREVPAGQLRFAPDSPLERDGFEPSVPGTKEPVFVAEGELRDRTGAAKKGCFLCGTDGSNPSPSSGESTANLTSSHARSRLKDETNYRAASDRADLAASLRRLVAHPTVEQHAQRRDEAERLV